MNAERTRAAAYVPWTTFRNSLDQLSQGLPHQIDKSVFIGKSGGTQNQLLAAMKFLGLVEEESGAPTDRLRALVKADEIKRRPLLKAMLEEAYPDLIELGLERATPEQLHERMEESYNVTGSTRQKAVRFFLQGAQEAGIKLSPFLEKAGTKPAPKRKRKTTRRRSRRKKASSASRSASGASRAVELSSGGKLTLAADLDFFALSPEDREFVFGLIASMEEYEAALNGAEDEDHEDDDDESE